MASAALTEALEILRTTLEGREAREAAMKATVDDRQSALNAATEELVELQVSCSGLRRAIKTLEAELKRAG